MSALTYLDTARIAATKQTCVPCSGTTRTGYGPKLATGWMLLLDGKRWHRMYIMCWSNSGTAYVRIKGVNHIVPSSYDIERAPRMYGPELR